jgi:Family of unknown function (DUF6152)
LNRYRLYIRVGAILLLELWVSPSFAHHSFSAEYNITAPMTLKGEITAIEWNNPHVFLRIAARDSAGASQLWHVEGGAISAMTANGWTSAMLQQLVKSHDPITVTGYRGRKKGTPSSDRTIGDEPASSNDFPLNEAWGKAIKLPDGRTLPFN